MAILLGAILIAILLIGRQLYGRYINPISVFPCVQLLSAFILYSSDFIDHRLIDQKTHLIYVISLLSYLIGVTLSALHKKHKNDELNSIAGQKETGRKEFYQGKIKLLGLLLLFATLFYWGVLIGSYGINNFLSSLIFTSASDYSSRVPTIISYLKMTSIFISPLCVYYIIEYKERRVLYWGILALTVVSNIAYTRNVLFYILILDLLVVAFARRKEKKKNSANNILYIIAGFAAVYFFNYTQTAFNKQVNLSGSFLGKGLTGSWITIISYLSGPLASTSIYFETIRNTPLLGHTMRSLIGFSGLFGIQFDTVAYQPTQFVQIPFRFNTATLQYYIFSEGGWIWTILFFFLCGFLYQKIYSDFMRNRSFPQMLLLCFLSLMLILSVREYILVRLDMFFYLLLLLVFYLQDRGKLKRIVFTFNK